MKNILSILCVFSMLSFAAQAGHNEKARSKCHWYAKRYVAEGHISTSKCGYKLSVGYDHGCTWAEVNFTKDWCCGTTAQVYSRADGSGAHGFFHGACAMCGGKVSELEAALAGDPGADEPVPYTPGNQDVNVVPQFGTAEVSIAAISVNMQSDVKDPAPNVYTLAVWVPNDDTIRGIEDTIYLPSKAIAEGTVTLRAGVLSVTGRIFNPRDFAVSRKEDIVTVTYVGGTKNVPVPASVGVDNVAVSSFGDILGDAPSTFRTTAGINEGVIEGKAAVNIYPNPAGSTLNVSVNTPEATTLSFSLYDLQGKLVMQQNDQVMSQGANTIQLNLSSLSAGEYFLLAEGKGIKVLKQIAKQ